MHIPTGLFGGEKPPKHLELSGASLRTQATTTGIDSIADAVTIDITLGSELPCQESGSSWYKYKKYSPSMSSQVVFVPTCLFSGPPGSILS